VTSQRLTLRGDEVEGVSNHSADALSVPTVVTKRSKARRRLRNRDRFEVADGLDPSGAGLRQEKETACAA